MRKSRIFGLITKGVAAIPFFIYFMLFELFFVLLGIFFFFDSLNGTKNDLMIIFVILTPLLVFFLIFLVGQILKVPKFLILNIYIFNFSGVNSQLCSSPAFATNASLPLWSLKLAQLM
jgi:hypothetical protein